MEEKPLQFEEVKPLQFEEEVQQLINNLQQKFADHNIRFIYVVATGSRSAGTYHEQSNLNLRGFYIGSRDSYLNVMRPPKEIRVEKQFKKANFHIFYIDYEFLDIKKYLYLATLPDKQQNDINLWFFSDIVYMNKMDAKIFTEIRNSCTFPLTAYVRKLILYSKAFPKQEKLNVRETYFALITIIPTYYNLIQGKQKTVFAQNDIWKVLDKIKQSFPEQEKIVLVLGSLLKKYIDLKTKLIQECNKTDEENLFIDLLVSIVEKNKPLQKKQAEIFEKDLKPQIEVDRANEIFECLFTNHSHY